MILRINNLGVIERAEINISKPFIVFTGPNGTGKTYLSYLLDELPVNFGGTLLTIIRKDKSGVLSSMFDPSVFQKKQVFKGKLDAKVLYDLYKKVVKSASAHILSALNLQLIEAEDFSIEIVTSYEEWEKELLGQRLNCGFFLRLEKDPGTFDFTVTAISGYDPQSGSKEDDNIFEMALFFNSIFFSGAANSTMFTAERTGIAVFSKEISVKRLMDNQQVFPRYPRAISRGLASAEDRVTHMKYSTDFIDLADQIEKSILKGKIITTPQGELRYRSHGDSFEIASSSSTVKALAELIFYIRHRAAKMSRLVIDEPEIHLHPDNQLIITRVFARMVNRGLQLIISTHSDYIIRELNNLIMLNYVGKDFHSKAAELGYKQKEEFLDASLIQPYLFQWNSDGRVVTEPISVGQDGFAVNSIDKAIAGLNDSAQAIYCAMIENA